MLPPNKTRELARNLVASETDESTASLQTEPATVRVYERLRRQLGAPLGIGGFQILATRALALAKSESPRLNNVLNNVKVTSSGGLLGLGKVESTTRTDEDGEIAVTLISQLLGLFLTFLGETTTLRLIEDLRLQAEVSTESTTAAESTIADPADGPKIAAAFEDLLVEIDRLRNVSVHIQALAENHPGMEDGLVNVAENIRSIATILDVFTLIRSKAGGSQEDPPDPKTNGYLN